jgi:hypothetical protein
MKMKPTTASITDIRWALQTIPANEFSFWQGIAENRSINNKILKIKSVRERYDLPLKLSKELVDEILGGTPIGPAQPVASPRLLDLIETIERDCRQATREAEECGHEPAAKAFLEFTKRLHALWIDQFDEKDENPPDLADVST